MFHRRGRNGCARRDAGGATCGHPLRQDVRIAGCVIVRQRPGTAKGIVFLSIEDETGIANVVVMPDMFDANRLLIVGSAVADGRRADSECR